MKDILDGFEVIGIMGLSKNAGKTTTLNKIIALYPHATIGLTSIGLDGERLDQVNYLPKPAVFVRRGMWVATTSTCLEHSDIPYEVLLETSHFTPIGRLMIVRVLNEGTLMIAGPSSNKALREVVSFMKSSCEKILIDGAFNRMAFSSIDVMDGVILSAGASYSASMDQTLHMTKQIVDLFQAKETNRWIDPKDAMVMFTDREVMRYPKKSLLMLDEILSRYHSIEALYYQGAITSKLMDLLMHSGLHDATLMMDHPSRWMASQRHFEWMRYKNIHLEVLHGKPILMVTINPYSTEGRHYDSKDMMMRFKQTIGIPIVNVMEGEDR